MSKGHAAAALLSAPKEAEATERPLSILRTKSGVLEGHYTIRFLFPLSGWIALLPISAVINARRANRKIDIPFLGQVDLLEASSRFGLTMGA